MKEDGRGRGSRPIRRRLRKLLLVCALSFVGLEAAYRVYLFRFASAEQFSKYAPLSEVPSERRIYRGHHYFNYCLNEAYRSPDGKNRHNSLGYRGEEIAREKPPGTYRIGCIGGSSTYDSSIPDYRLSFPHQLELVLHEKYDAPEVEVINAGCGGWSSFECLIDLQFRLLELAPDLLVVYHGTNDVYPRLVPPKEYRRDNSGYRMQWSTDASLWEHSAVLRWLGIRLGWAKKTSVGALTVRGDRKDAAREDWLAANPPTFYAQNLEDTIALARHRGVAILLSTWAWCPSFGDHAADPLYQRAFAELNAVVREVARKNAVELFDFVALMPTDREYWADGRHSNERGARRKAELFAAFIAEHFLARRTMPVQTGILSELRPGSVPGMTALEFPLFDGLPVRGSIGVAPDGTAILGLAVLEELREPDVLVYWSPSAPAAQGGLPEKARLVGSLGGIGERYLPLPREAGAPGHLLLYSLAHHELIGSAALEPP